MTSANTRSAAPWAIGALAAVLLLGALSGVASAQNHRDNNQHWNQRGLDRRAWDHRGWDNRNYGHRGDGRWSGGYYSPPPVVYSRPYYAPPPVVYDPGIGIYLPGLNLNFR